MIIQRFFEKRTRDIKHVNPLMSVTTDLYDNYVSSLVRGINKTKCHPLPQKLPVWT